MGFSVNRRSSLRSPACAGKRRPPTPLGAFAPDHPRVCGEKIVRSMSIVTSRGSPLRVRGKAIGQLCNGVISGDHPRVCGEKTYHYELKDWDLGSPPRVRGKGQDILRPFHRRGITPACAGKRSRSRRSRLHSWDHPRVCGEKAWSSTYFLITLGSPPRVRGKVTCNQQMGCLKRITPACAGKRHTTMS